MNGWSKEDLEEMCGDDIVEQLAFLSGCHQHELCNGNPSGWIIPDEVLRRFAELIIQDYATKLVRANMSNPAYARAMDAYYEEKWAHRFD